MGGGEEMGREERKRQEMTEKRGEEKRGEGRGGEERRGFFPGQMNQKHTISYSNSLEFITPIYKASLP